MSDGILFIVSAPSGAGKTSLVNRLLERDPKLALSISCTTRPPRVGERDGVNYHFIDTRHFEQCLDAGDFLEHARVFGNLYGTRAADVSAGLRNGHDLVLEIDWQGARQVRERFRDAVGIFVLPPSIGELERRLQARSTDSAEVIAARMAQARAEMAHAPEYDYLVVNDRFETALDTLGAIVAAERCRAKRQCACLGDLLVPRDSQVP